MVHSLLQHRMLYQYSETHRLGAAGERGHRLVPQMRARFTMPSTAFSISCADPHSSREWKLCSPAKMLGVGSPMNVSREPSVPPRIARDLTSSPACRTA